MKRWERGLYILVLNNFRFTFCSCLSPIFNCTRNVMGAIVKSINYRTLLRVVFLLLKYCISGVSDLDAGTQLRVLSPLHAECSLKSPQRHQPNLVATPLLLFLYRYIVAKVSALTAFNNYCSLDNPVETLFCFRQQLTSKQMLFINSLAAFMSLSVLYKKAIH